MSAHCGGLFQSLSGPHEFRPLVSALGDVWLALSIQEEWARGEPGIFDGIWCLCNIAEDGVKPGGRVVLVGVWATSLLG